ncbi:nucleoside-diphosphate kinase [Salidesulfovibrio onnuriiensis]|uniref:nucleoside-diphosphate kinase n=1 Tax=Salidesulfovibrio onnuriiensis TaxID=2583823 RepID=UPI0011CBAFDB|nr:nucleoside-diphosphate kinase [Salidesulfovibrio onnuriiensis]
MSTELTFSIIKPDAVAAGNIGAILQMITDGGLKIKATKMIHMTRAQAEGFYAVHRERPFFGELVDFMISGPAVVSVLEGENAIKRYRELMGATNPAEAAEGTIRKKFAANIQNNAVHGSDAPETAAVEVAYFFSNLEMVG